MKGIDRDHRSNFRQRDYSNSNSKFEFQNQNRDFDDDWLGRGTNQNPGLRYGEMGDMMRGGQKG